MTKLPDDIAIRVNNIHKDFHLPHNNEDSIKHKIITVFEKKDKEIDTQHALRGITFDIKKGEFFGILGRNGSGKSTLLKIIAEIYTPTGGRVQHRGSMVAFIELGVGFNPQLTGRENVYLNAALLGFNRKEIDAFYDEVVEFAELEEHMEQQLKNYSSGMKVRLAFAVAIQANADILVLDEVLAVGDAAFQRKCYNYFKELKEAHKTIIFVSHSMGLIREYCDKAILIEDGKITHEGEAEDIANAYTQLFNKPDDPKQGQSDIRWGSNEATFTAVSAVMNEEELTVMIDMVGNHDVKGIVFSLDIHKEKILVTGLDHQDKIAHKFDLKKGQHKKFKLIFDNYFGGGDHSISVSLRSANGSYVYDFWKGAVVVTNPREVGNYYPALLPVHIEEN